MSTCFHHGCVTCRDFSKLFNDPKFSDVKIYTKEQILLVNSILISQHSPVLKDKLLVGDKDIILEEFMEEETTVKVVFQAMYHRDALIITPETFPVLIKISLALAIDWIVIDCVEFARKNLSPETFVMYFETGHRMVQYFVFDALINICVDYVETTEQLLQVLITTEQLDVNNVNESLIVSLLKNNKVSRDETRMGKLLMKWLEATGDTKLVTHSLSVINLAQVYAADKEFHTALFKFLIGLDLSADDRKMVLEISMHSVAQGQKVTVVNTFEDISMQPSDILNIVKSGTWKEFTFDQFMQLRRTGISGFEEHIFIELFLVWAKTNFPTVAQFETLLGSLDLINMTQEYTADVIAHIKHEGFSPASTAQVEQKLIAILEMEHKVGEFSRQVLSKGNLKSLQSKKHTVTKRPCCVKKCKNKTLGCIDMKLTRDAFPYYTIAKSKTSKSSLEHPHNIELSHAYFIINEEIVSCIALSWLELKEKLEAPDIQVTFVVVHKHIQ